MPLDRRYLKNVVSDTITLTLDSNSAIGNGGFMRCSQIFNSDGWPELEIGVKFSTSGRVESHARVDVYAQILNAFSKNGYNTKAPNSVDSNGYIGSLSVDRGTGERSNSGQYASVEQSHVMYAPAPFEKCVLHIRPVGFTIKAGSLSVKARHITRTAL